MIGDWSTEVTREYSGPDALFDLPVRPLGRLRLLGFLLVAVGLLFVWTPAQALRAMLRPLPEAPPGAPPLASGLFLFPFFVAGCLPILLGLLVLLGRCRVEWRGGRLRVSERLGPLRFTRRLPRTPLRGLQVLAAPARGGSGFSTGAAADPLGALVAQYEAGPRRLVALGYPRSWLLALAEEVGRLAGAGIGPAVRVSAHELAGSGQAEEPAPRPAASRVTLEEWRDGLRMSVPPAGLWRGSRGLFLFAVVWCAFIAVFTVLATVGRLAEQAERPWMPWAFVGVFWVVGLSLMAVAVNMGRRTAEIAVTNGQLRIATRGLFGARQHEWLAGELTAIRADGSGMEVNERPVLELQVHPRVGKRVGLLAGRDDDELRWIASRLREALAVPARASVD
jgi:hypothetical protein